MKPPFFELMRLLVCSGARALARTYVEPNAISPAEAGQAHAPETRLQSQDELADSIPIFFAEFERRLDFAQRPLVSQNRDKPLRLVR